VFDCEIAAGETAPWLRLVAVVPVRGASGVKDETGDGIVVRVGTDVEVEPAHIEGFIQGQVVFRFDLAVMSKLWGVVSVVGVVERFQDLRSEKEG